MLTNTELLNKRAELENQIIGASISSKVTGDEGVIISISNKHVYLNFTCSKSIPVSFETFLNCVEVDDALANSINDYLDTYIKEKKQSKKQ